MSKYSVVDSVMFSEIKVDDLYIIIDGYKVKRNGRVGIFNLIVNRMREIKKALEFGEWLCDEYGVKELTDDVKERYEDRLKLDTIGIVYRYSLRIMWVDDVLYFYGLREGSVLQLLGDSSDKVHMFRSVVSYVQYSKYCNDYCDKNGIENPIGKRDGIIVDELKACLVKKIIPSIEKIHVLSNTLDKYCLAYYDLNEGDASIPTPAWDNFVYQIRDEGAKECFKAFIYSIFKDDNFSRQVLWLFGRGNCGKSAVARAIEKVLTDMNKDIVGGLPSKWHMDKNTSASLVNKRLITGADFTERTVLREQLVKNITGNDNVVTRGLYKEERVVNLYSKVMITSNKKPYIDVEKPEELSRIILISVDYELAKISRDRWITATMGQWDKELYLEAKHFIAKCKTSYYKRLSNDGNNFLMYDTMIKELDEIGDSLHKSCDLWWENCVVYTGNNTDVLDFDELMNDFRRFLDRGYVSKYVLSSYYTHIFKKVRTLNITIFETDFHQNNYIVGYKVKSYAENEKPVIFKNVLRNKIKQKLVDDSIKELLND